MTEQTQVQDACGFRYVELEYREFSNYAGANLYHNPEHFKCHILGQISIRMRTGSHLLIAWADQFTGKVFFWEGYTEDLKNLKLERKHYEYSDYGRALYEVEDHSLFQFCHYILGFGMKLASEYDKETRMSFCRSVCSVFGRVFK